jgi:hypothetical protein
LQAQCHEFELKIDIHSITACIGFFISIFVNQTETYFEDVVAKVFSLRSGPLIFTDLAWCAFFLTTVFVAVIGCARIALQLILHIVAAYKRNRTLARLPMRPWRKNEDAYFISCDGDLFDNHMVLDYPVRMPHFLWITSRLFGWKRRQLLLGRCWVTCSVCSLNLIT